MGIEGVSNLVQNILYQLYVKKTPLWVLRVYNLVESFLLLASCTRLYDSRVHTERLVGKAKSGFKDLFMDSNYHFEALWSIMSEIALKMLEMKCKVIGLEQ